MNINDLREIALKAAYEVIRNYEPGVRRKEKKRKPMFMEAFEKIIFMEEEYFLIGDMITGGPIVTKTAYEAGEVPFAHLFEDGNIRRFNNTIGNINDITFTGEFVTMEQSEDAMFNALMGFGAADILFDDINEAVLSQDPFFPPMLMPGDLDIVVDMSLNEEIQDIIEGDIDETLDN